MNFVNHVHPRSLYINKVVPAKRTRALVTALEPTEQADRVECVLAGRASLVGCLHIRGNDGITDRTFALALQSTLYIASECEQSVNQVAV